MEKRKGDEQRFCGKFAKIRTAGFPVPSGQILNGKKTASKQNKSKKRGALKLV